MKKEYIPILEKDALLSEPAFLEEFWTQIWDEHNISDDIVSGIENKEEHKIIEPYLSSLSPNARILDGGCGLGYWTLYYGSKGFDTLGLDISQATIKKLKDRFPKKNFILGNILDTGFENDYFDAYFSWGTFEHSESGLGAALKEARRILKVGGYLFISVPYQNRRQLRRDKRKLWQWDDNFVKDKGYQTKMRFYQWRLTKPELEREFEINGFKMLKVEAIHKRFGLYRTIRHDLHVNPDSRKGKILQSLLYPFVPTDYVAHIILGIGQKI